MKMKDIMNLDFPSLRSIQLGTNALAGIGNEDDSCSLIMRSNNEMIQNDLNRPSESNIYPF